MEKILATLTAVLGLTAYAVAALRVTAVGTL